MKQILIVILVSSIAFTTVAAAQPTGTISNGTASTADSVATVSSTSTPGTSTPQRGAGNITAPAEAPKAELVIDENAIVRDYEYRDGDMVLWVWSNEYKPLSVAPQPESGSESGTQEIHTEVLQKDNITVARVSTSGGVTLWTGDSMKENRWHYIRKPSQYPISGPWSGGDVRNAAIGGALGVVISVLYEAVQVKIGSGERGEHVA